MLEIEGITRLTRSQNDTTADCWQFKAQAHSTITVVRHLPDQTACDAGDDTMATTRSSTSRNSNCRSWSRRCIDLGSPAIPRAPDLPVDLSPRRDRFRGDDRPRPRPARAAGNRVHDLDAGRSSGREQSADGTTKFLLRLADGTAHRIGLHPRHAGQTFCISTQVGCAMKCAFCLTGKMGIDPQPDRGRDRRPGARAAARARAARAAIQHRPHGHGRAAAQLRCDDEGAADAGRRARAGACRRGA